MCIVSSSSHLSSLSSFFITLQAKEYVKQNVYRPNSGSMLQTHPSPKQPKQQLSPARQDQPQQQQPAYYNSARPQQPLEHPQQRRNPVTSNKTVSYQNDDDLVSLQRRHVEE